MNLNWPLNKGGKNHIENRYKKEEQGEEKVELFQTVPTVNYVQKHHKTEGYLWMMHGPQDCNWEDIDNF